MPRPALIAGPTLLLVGLLMMLTPSAWLAAHLVFLAGTLLVPWTAVVLHELLVGAPAWLRRTGLALTCAGALALAGQFLIDFVVAQLAGTGDRGPLFDRVQESPVFDAVFYTAGPALMYVGLLVSGAGLVGLGRRIGWLLVAGTLVVGLSRLLGDRLVEVVGTVAVVVACAVVAMPAARPGRAPEPLSR